MCGIAGVVDQRLAGGSKELAAIVNAMSATLAHRGPDGQGCWVDSAVGAALAHRRLAVVDLSAAASQPMESRDGRLVIVYNGEIYNAPELRAELTGQGVVFRTHSDTEVVLEACRLWGTKRTLTRLAGMFAFALWDTRECMLTLVRDRMGIKPLYWRLDSGRLIFGSELKALRACPGWQPEIDRDTFASFFSRLYPPGPSSIYRGVHKLPPGTMLTWRSGREHRIQSYWSLTEATVAGRTNPLTADDRVIAEAMETTLAEVMRGHLISDVSMGAFLSGGVDSSTVVALMKAAGSNRPRTFSIGYDVAGFDESNHAATVAHYLDTDHQELRLDASDALRVIPRLAEIHDEPLADGSQVPTILVSELARQNVTVVLSGDGGDELFGGYDRYWERAAQWNRIKSLPWSGPLAALLDRLPPGAVAGPLRRLGLLADARRSLPVIRQLLRLPVIDEFYATSQFVWPNPPVSFPFTQGHPQAWPELSESMVPDPLDRMQFADAVTVLPDDLLVKVDRASMAVGLEVRVPLLDHRLVELACRIPASMRRRGNAAKWPLRLVLDKRIPPTLVNRPKMGFHMPMTHWLKGPLRPWAEELLAPARLGASNLFDIRTVRAEWASFLSGDDGRTYDAIWGVLMAQAWLERWGDA